MTECAPLGTLERRRAEVDATELVARYEATVWLGGLAVLVRAASLDVGLEQKGLGPPQLVLFDPATGR
jgi:hypothetical protein